MTNHTFVLVFLTALSFASVAHANDGLKKPGFFQSILDKCNSLLGRSKLEFIKAEEAFPLTKKTISKPVRKERTLEEVRKSEANNFEKESIKSSFTLAIGEAEKNSLYQSANYGDEIRYVDEHNLTYVFYCLGEKAGKKIFSAVNPLYSYDPRSLEFNGSEDFNKHFSKGPIYFRKPKAMPSELSAYNNQALSILATREGLHFYAKTPDGKLVELQTPFHAVYDERQAIANSDREKPLREVVVVGRDRKTSRSSDGQGSAWIFAAAFVDERGQNTAFIHDPYGKSIEVSHPEISDLYEVRALKTPIAGKKPMNYLEGIKFVGKNPYDDLSMEVEALLPASLFEETAEEASRSIFVELTHSKNDALFERIAYQVKLNISAKFHHFTINGIQIPVSLWRNYVSLRSILQTKPEAWNFYDDSLFLTDNGLFGGKRASKIGSVQLQNADYPWVRVSFLPNEKVEAYTLLNSEIELNGVKVKIEDVIKQEIEKIKKDIKTDFAPELSTEEYRAGFWTREYLNIKCSASDYSICMERLFGVILKTK